MSKSVRITGEGV